jgi:histidine triad (HIT) family protein
MTIFAKIIAGEIPCHKIWEDDNHLAFLDIRPINRGHALIIPKKEHDYIFDISAQEYQDLWAAAHKVANLLQSKVECKRVVTMVLGYEVHHTHIHLIPTQSEKDVIPFTPISMTQQELGELAVHIRGNALGSDLSTTEQVVSFWDEFAPLFTKNHESTTIRLAKSAMEHLQLNTATRILEVGGGGGGSAFELRSRTPSHGEIISTDISPVMQKIATEKQIHGVAFQIADAQNLPFDNASFDRYFANLNLMLIPDPQKTIQEAARVLQEDNSIAVWTVWGRPEFSPMMTLLMESLCEVGIETPPVARSNFHLGTRTKLQGWLKESGFHNLTMWYQPMVVSFDDPLQFATDFVHNRRDLRDMSDDIRRQIIENLHQKIQNYRQRCEAISLDTLVVVAHK